MSKKAKVCIVSCSVLKDELRQLVKQGKLDAELVFVSKYFHVDYEMVEKNLRLVLEAALKRYPGRVVLVYGDLCMGPNGEMKKLADEYGAAKVDALNCVDCQLGGKGAWLTADPEHNLMFMGPGMIEFFVHMREAMRKEGVDEAALKGMFSGIKGLVVLDTLGDREKICRDLEKADMGLPVLEIREVGVEGVKQTVDEALKRTG